MIADLDCGGKVGCHIAAVENETGWIVRRGPWSPPFESAKGGAASFVVVETWASPPGERKPAGGWAVTVHETSINAQAHSAIAGSG